MTEKVRSRQESNPSVCYNLKLCEVDEEVTCLQKFNWKQCKVEEKVNRLYFLNESSVN